MIATVHGPGTATNIRPGLTYLIASKTGTAQVVSRRGTAAMNPRSLPMHLRHRGLFIAYAPADAPTIAIAVAIEGGGYGASSAAPVARKVLDAWLLGKMPVPAPAQAAAGDPAVAASADADSQAVPPVATEPAR
jgi:penicillin-binding protein 2